MFKPKEKIFFVHIPKNAGNSIRPICRKENIKVITHNIRRRNKRLLEAFRGKRKIHAFCISRNPYDRMVSAYFYLLNKTTNKNDLIDREKYITEFRGFKEFIKNGLLKAANEQIHFLPQTFWILNKEGKPEIETILKVENLQNDFNTFSKYIGLKPRELGITNKSVRNKWEDYYDMETKKIVSEIYHNDFEFFNYKK